MKSLREQERAAYRAARLKHAERLLAEAGSVRGAAKLAGMHRANFGRLLRTLRQTGRILTQPSTPPTS